MQNAADAAEPPSWTLFMSGRLLGKASEAGERPAAPWHMHVVAAPAVWRLRVSDCSGMCPCLLCTGGVAASGGCELAKFHAARERSSSALCFHLSPPEEGHHHKHHFTHYVKRVEIQLDPAQVCGASPGLAALGSRV